MASTDQNLVPTTQRAYTLRLRPAYVSDDSMEERKRKVTEMQTALWATHEAVNRGAKVFGDWLLTLRGGLDHNLATARVKDKKSERDPSQQDIKNRRILLALSWLSVEDEHGAHDHPEYIVAYGEGCRRQQDNQDSRDRKVLAALRDILVERGVSDEEIGNPEVPSTWLGDCKQSLSAAIRPDAVWVNRSAMFQQGCAVFQGLDSHYATETILSFFGPSEEYFKIADDSAEEEVSSSDNDGADFRQRARQWMSINFGTGKKSDTSKIGTALEQLANCNLNGFAGATKSKLIAHLLMELGADNADCSEEKLRVAVGWSTGRPSKGRLAIQNLPNTPTDEALRVLQKKFAEEAAEKLGSASSRNIPSWIAQFQEHVEGLLGVPYVCARNLIGEYSVMLDHAARRVSIAHSWIKRAEAERRSFEASARKVQDVPEATRMWLDEFSEFRSGTTGAAGYYRIRPRAIQGWDVIVQRWFQEDCITEQDRIDVARVIQADWDDEKKFGDIQLFEALASEEATLVWKVGEKPDPSLLLAYVVARDAEARQIRFKVPAYRHPDPLSHPVFCDFGNSRWSLKFAIHEFRKSQTKNKRKKEPLNNLHDVQMGLWTGQSIEAMPLHWASRRLIADFALNSTITGDATPVSRASRLGRAAAGASQDVTILNVFEEDDWNGRLQAPREQLDRVAALRSHNKHVAAARLQNSLRWFLTFSPRVQPTGPFHEFANENGIKPNKKGEYYPNADLNKARSGKAKAILSRLPGLRLLSVDLGHRFAAAGAVWQTLSLAEFSREIDSARSQGARIEGSPQGLYVHIIHKREKTDKKRNKVKTIKESTIYRRIGTDEIVDRSNGELIAHPSPWARLDRQFLIKLQGEERAARHATPDEEKFICQMEHTLGRVRDKNDKDDALPREVDDLQWEVVRTARLALKRHGNRARIAFAMTADYKPMPGDRKYFFEHEHRETWDQNDGPEQRRQKHIEFLQDALNLWHQLSTSSSWQDEAAKLLWETHIASLPNYQQPEGLPDDLRGAERKKKRGENLDRLRPTAEALLNDPSLRVELHKLWCQRWDANDGEWRKYLRKLQDWIRPSKNVAEKSIYNVGGLSLQRLATLTELRRKVQAAYFSRLHPDGHKELLKEQFGQRSLDALERMREQRVKQLASRIVEAALGVGRKQEDEKRRPRIPRDPSCHAIVIESLRHYRPDDLRTRRENRALMDWSSGKVRKYLEESCQLHGLHLREVPPNYTSRQCSRTALPGIRCEECTVEQFKTSPRWKKIVEKAKERLKKGGSDEDRLLADLWAKFEDVTATDSRKKPIRLPRAGGDLFFAAPSYEHLERLERHAPCMAEDCELCNSTRCAIQADLNAAANIGLRALLDPDFPGKWWFVPCGVKDGKPAQDQVKGSACFDNPEIELLKIGEKSNEKKKSKDRKDVVYAWRDPSGGGLQSAHSWPGTTEYWNMVKSRAIRALRLYNGLAPKANSGKSRDFA